MRKLNVLIAGSTGYIGVQLVKLLVKHKYVNIKYLCGNSSIGKNISYFDKDLKKNKLPKITKFNFNFLATYISIRGSIFANVPTAPEIAQVDISLMAFSNLFLFLRNS